MYSDISIEIFIFASQFTPATDGGRFDKREREKKMFMLGYEYINIKYREIFQIDKRYDGEILHYIQNFFYTNSVTM